MNHVFCFVSSKITENYSKLALDSFFKHTKLEEGDIFVFVNNDGTNAFRKDYPIDIYVNNKTPRSWAENFNKGLRVAKKFKKHFVVITNDIVFTKGWLETLKQKDDMILIPVCNVNFMYKSPGFSTAPTMQLDEYIGKEKYLDSIVTFHQNNFKFEELSERIFMQMYLDKQLVATLEVPCGKTRLTVSDKACPGLSLEMRNPGGSSWRVRYSYQKIQHCLTIGKVSDLSLDEARQIGFTVKTLLAKKEDPSQVLSQSKAHSSPTFSQFIEKHYLPHIRSYKRCVSADETLLDNHLI